MRVVVFGATGKIGQFLVPYILEQDSSIEVIAIGHRKEDVFHHPYVDYYSVDICNQIDFGKLPSKIDAVINMAGAVTTAVNSNDIRAYIDANIIGAVNILDYAISASADRIIYSQTYNDVFGDPDSDVIIKPDALRRKQYKGEAAIYAITKNTAVDIQKLYQSKYGIKSFVLRLPTVQCPTLNPYYMVGGEKRLRPFRKMINQACNGEPIEIWGDPNHVMDMVYVKDCCQLFYLVLKADVNGGVYNIGTGVGTTLLQQAEGMIAVFSKEGNKSRIIYRPEKLNGKPFIMDIENAKRDLGYQPQYNYLDMLKEFKSILKL